MGVMESEGTVKITVEFTFDKFFLADEEHVREEFGGDWTRLINHYIEEDGLTEVLSWAEQELKIISIVDCERN